MWIILWDPFLIKKLLKNRICGSINSAQIHCSSVKKSTNTGWNEKKKKNPHNKIADATIIWIQTALGARLDTRLRFDPSAFCVFYFILFFFFFTRFGKTRLLFMYCSINSNRKYWLFCRKQCIMYCSWTHKFHFLTTFSLKMGPTVLFTHLKIILLHWFQ